MRALAEVISKLSAPIQVPLGLLWLPCALVLLGLGMAAVGSAELWYLLKDGRA